MVAAILKTESLPHLTQTFLSLDENLRAKEGGKEKTGLSSFPSHGSLRFKTNST